MIGQSTSPSAAGIWVLADDRAGTAAQCLGVAEALEWPFATKRLRYKPRARLPNAAQGATLIGLSDAARGQLAPPWPGLVIAAGRRTAPVARYIGKQSGGRTVLVQVMHPGNAGSAEFDLIAVPRHDRIAERPNLLRITGAPHRVRPEALSAAAAEWRSRFTALPRPWIALIVGGATRRRKFTGAMAADLGAAARHLAAAAGGSLLVTTSRRTGQAADALLLALAEAGGPPVFTYDWRAGGDNPYLGMLGLADGVIVTGDSVSMASEACATSGPVYIHAPPGFATPKHQRLHRELYELGLARPFGEKFTPWRHPPLNAADDIARAIKSHLGAGAGAGNKGK